MVAKTTKSTFDYLDEDRAPELKEHSRLTRHQCINRSVCDYHIAHGESIRPMAWAVFLLIIGVVSFCIGIITTVANALRRRYINAILCFLFSITPIPLAFIIVYIFIAMKGLKIQP